MYMSMLDLLYSTLKQKGTATFWFYDVPTIGYIAPLHPKDEVYKEKFSNDEDLKRRLIVGLTHCYMGITSHYSTGISAAIKDDELIVGAVQHWYSLGDLTRVSKQLGYDKVFSLYEKKDISI